MGLFSKDGITKGVIVTAFGGAGTTGLVALATYLGLTPPSFVAWLNAVARFWATDVTLPRWWFWVWAALSVTTVTLFALRILYAFAVSGPAWATYRSDVLFGLRWRWTFSANGEVQHLPQMFCPNCDHQFRDADFRYATPTASGPVWSLNCETCGYEVTVPNSVELYRRVKAEAERRIRTGDWKRATSKQSRQTTAKGQ